MVILKLKNTNSPLQKPNFDDVEISKIVVSHRVAFGKNGLMLPKTRAYRRHFDKTIHVFFIKTDELLEKYNEIWIKVSKATKKEFDSEHVYNNNIKK